ncbi:MAG: hypothetical protein ACK4F2_10405 [Novosphingobium meiothermophilum]|uniref:hypothetical protein n=1 Tax=Novosphingobium meiothermophilum TaxID=2202251 RepID=UPI001374D1B2|nr:hypothetical protein [Novosphingobium meiothermophilum]
MDIPEIVRRDSPVAIVLSRGAGTPLLTIFPVRPAIWADLAGISADLVCAVTF